MGVENEVIGPERILTTADAVGGVWRYAVDLGRALNARGLHTVVVVMGPPPSGAQRREAQDAGLELIERPYRLEWMPDPWTDVARAGEWLLDLERTVEPSLVHLNGYAHAALPWRAPAMVVAHSCVRSWWRAVKREPAPPEVDRYSAAVKDGLTAADAVIAPTAAMGQALQTEYGVPRRVTVIPNGAPRSSGDPWNGKAHVVLAAGRAWDEAKNIRTVCESAASIPWPVYVAGDRRSPSGDECDLGGVTLLGRLQPSDMAEWYRRASIYALPAAYEPFGLSVLEAAAAGCALVLGDIPSLRENWDEAAVFVAPGDPMALSEAVRSLIASTELRRDLARRAYARAANFSIDRTADRYLDVYQSLIS